MALYNADGQINLTAVDGSSYTGLYAADGSINIVLNDGSAWTGRYHPCGAWNAVVVSDSSTSAINSNGSLNVISNSFGGYSPLTPLGGVRVSNAPLIFVDRANGVYKASGASYASEALATAVLDPNRVISGITTVIGPVLVAGAREEVTNGTFDANINGWSVTQTSGGPATQSWDATGKLALSTNGATGSRSEQMLALTAGESYQIEADITRGTIDTGFVVGTEATYAFQQTNGMLQQTTGTAHKKSSFVAGVSRTRAALRANSSGTSTSNLDNATIKLCRAANGWARKHRWIISAVAKVAPTNDEYLLCLANPGATSVSATQDYLAIYRRSSDGHLVVELKSNVSQQSSILYLSQDLGAVADGATFTVELWVSNRIKVALNGGALQALAATAPVNYPVIHIGKAPSGGTSTWTGTINSYQVDFPAGLTDSAFAIFGVGNSLPWGVNSSPRAGLTGLSWYSRLCRDNLAGAAWYNNIANAGATSQQARDGIYGTGVFANDLTRNPEYSNSRTVLVVWAIENDTSAAGGGRANVADIVAKWQSINPAGRFIVVEPLLWADGTHTPSDMLQMRLDFRSDWGANSFDLAGYLTAPTKGGTSCQALDDAGVTPTAQDVTDFNAGYLPVSLRDGGTSPIHPNNLGSIPIANAFALKLAALGYT